MMPAVATNLRRCGLIFRSPGTTCRSMRRVRDSQSGVVDLLVAEILQSCGEAVRS
jgi:hypothetical protein